MFYTKSFWKSLKTEFTHTVTIIWTCQYIKAWNIVLNKVDFLFIVGPLWHLQINKGVSVVQTNNSTRWFYIFNIRFFQLLHDCVAHKQSIIDICFAVIFFLGIKYNIVVPWALIGVRASRYLVMNTLLVEENVCNIRLTD